LRRLSSNLGILSRELSIMSIKKQKLFRFHLHLQTHPESDEVVAKYSKPLIDESARQFNFQCEIFKRLGEKEPKKTVIILFISASRHHVDDIYLSRTVSN
jgi:hypothetical protein